MSGLIVPPSATESRPPLPVVPVRLRDGRVVKRVVSIVDPCDIPITVSARSIGIVAEEYYGREPFTPAENRNAASWMVPFALHRLKERKAEAEA